MTLQTVRPPMGIVQNFLPSGASDAAEKLAQLIAASRDHLEITARFGAPLNDLAAATMAARHENWDGEGAKAAQIGAVAQAQRLLQALMLEPSRPEISIDADGEVAFDWYFDRGRRLAASIAADGAITYAAIDGRDHTRGTTYFTDEIPPKLLAILDQLAQRA